MKSGDFRRIKPEMSDSSFLEEVKKMSGGDKILDCIQCGICAGSCHARFAMDYSPMQVLKMAHLGLKKEVLSSSTIWICASCYTCASRCPRGLNIPAIMSGFKNMAMKDNVPAPIALKPKFHKTFTEIVEKYGRMHEPQLQMKLTAKTDVRALMRNASLGLRMLRKGKISLKPSKLSPATHFTEIVTNVLKEEAPKK
jgi:heterodisulfide reductase subunit C